MSDSKVKVAVRVRPLNKRELSGNTRCVVDMVDTQTVLSPPTLGTADTSYHNDARKQAKTFRFDYCFWSIDETNKEKFSGQDVVFQCLGEDLLDNAFDGYNACIFAYGQTGSGKSYTMMGTAEQPGLIPRLCCELFQRRERLQSADLSCKLEVSYLEIYNERVRDLLDPKGSQTALKVREHQIFGPYVDGLSQLAVTSYQDIDSLMSEGNKSRTVAATNMNEESSRSHAVFTITLTQTLTDLASGTSGEKVSKISLVDLAGSERASKTGAAGDRLIEGSNINKSLSTLGLVISSLADQAAGKNKNKFVPYRDSVLTWLLKDNLGGNSRTAMVATVSPSADNYEETLSTLRYADRAKRIVNHAVVNEDPNARIIRELRDEVDKLRGQLNQAESMKAPELQERLQESEKLMKEMTVTWEQKLRKTEEVAQERQRQLESLGISLASSGIKVGDDKSFLVNLNADPALNELLVYYLKEHTLVGADDSQDVQLCGLGILAQHCTITMDGEGTVTLTPREGARTCVNGAAVTVSTKLWHGDRILWGNNHFFRVNLPRCHRERRAASPAATGFPGWSGEAAAGKGQEPEEWEDPAEGRGLAQDSPEPPCTFEFAQMEVIAQTPTSSSARVEVESVVRTLERQYEQDKEAALLEQRAMYETELRSLREALAPERHAGPGARHGASPRLSMLPSTQHRLSLWAQERDEQFRQSLARLREQIVRADALVWEANLLSEEMSRCTDFQVTLQIPAGSLRAHSKRGMLVSEPAVQVRRQGQGTQLWSLEKLENRLVVMRDLYQNWKQSNYDPLGAGARGADDPFFEAQVEHDLIGVANLFLESLMHDVRLAYAAPIVNQQGEVAGRLHMELQRVSGPDPDRMAGGDDPSDESDGSSDSGDAGFIRQLVFKVRIKEAVGLPAELAHFVFCQYSVWGHKQVVTVPPQINPDSPSPVACSGPATVRFDHTQEFSLPVSEELQDVLTEEALSVDVWGHRLGASQIGHEVPQWEPTVLQEKTRSLQDRWSDVTRRVELWVQVQEVSEQGDYVPVEVRGDAHRSTGGVFALRQGRSRRVLARVSPVQGSGNLPIVPESILSVSVGCIEARSTKGAGSQKDREDVDSYQEDGLLALRERWSEALSVRREYLDAEIQELVAKPDKSEVEKERESRLVSQWVGLTEERNAVLVPAPGSGVPGAPAEGTPAPGMEQHFPVLFLDLNEDLSCGENFSEESLPGLTAFLPGEYGSQFYYLPIVRHDDDQVQVVASWDASVHDSPHLNRVTPPNEVVYAIIKVTVQMSAPSSVEVVLRKRICLTVGAKPSIGQYLKRRMSFKGSVLQASAVTYEVVSNIPKASEQWEDGAALALLAARGEGGEDGESYMDKYTRRILALGNLLNMERLRQEVALMECLTAKGKHVRKSCSTPNVHALSGSRLDLSSGYEDEDSKRFPGSTLELSSAMRRSCQELSPPQNAASARTSTPHMGQEWGAAEGSPVGSRPSPRYLKPLTPLRQNQLISPPKSGRSLVALSVDSGPGHRGSSPDRQRGAHLLPPGRPQREQRPAAAAAAP
uniref:Kinesin-like protein KIF13A isoform X2 n=1 Tax=Petromyzon marinus TaxID=7757 RepID=A0AAJ7TDS0_PETMA|nr:kinesin-like protein KIF13A isoform X2 [Petromyzon marinus]